MGLLGGEEEISQRWSELRCDVLLDMVYPGSSRFDTGVGVLQGRLDGLAARCKVCSRLCVVFA